MVLPTRSLPARQLPHSQPHEQGVARRPPTYGIELADRASEGRPLPGDVRGKLERSFESDFSQVRVFEGDAAPRLGARALARGAELHFGPGSYAPHTLLGQARIGHELAHLVQQSRGQSSATTRSGGVGIDASPLRERQANLAGARAALGRPAGMSGRIDPGASAVVQREVEGNNLREVLQWQQRLQQAAIARPADYAYKYTTVGFEHEFAQMSDGPLHGVDHLELSRSVAPALPFTNIPFVLETDASNSVELVSPPFLIATRPTGWLSNRSNRQPVPLADDIAKIDGFYRATLQDVIMQARRSVRTARARGGFDYRTEYDNKRLGDVLVALHNQTGIDLPLGNVAIEPYQLSPATPRAVGEDSNTVTGATIADIHVKPSSKGPMLVRDGERGNIITQINFATTAKIADRLQRESDRRADLRPRGAERITDVFRTAEDTIRTRLVGATNPSDKLRRCYNALARALSGQLAVPYLALVRHAQEDALAWDTRMAELDEYTSDELSFAESIGSHVKDTSGVWVKDMVLNLGLERLSREEWQTVLARISDPVVIAAIKVATSARFPDPPPPYVPPPLIAPRTQIERMRAAQKELERAQKQNRASRRRDGFAVASGEASEAALARIAALIATDIKPDVADGFDARKAALHFGQTGGRRLEFGQHDARDVGPRQDTYIKSQNVQNNLWATRRLHVVETRADSLEKQLELIRLVGG